MVEKEEREKERERKKERRVGQFFLRIVQVVFLKLKANQATFSETKNSENTFFLRSVASQQ
jgi:hypothetical protein